MTSEATKFITPMTLQTLSRQPVAVNLWEEGNGWQPGHIELADKADLVLVAPATAHCIGCFAQGLAPDLLTAIYLATPAPVMIAPAMNGKMFQHPAVQQNLKTLTERGHQMIEPGCGLLACGYEGIGKLAEVDKIIQEVITFLPKIFELNQMYFVNRSNLPKYRKISLRAVFIKQIKCSQSFVHP